MRKALFGYTSSITTNYFHLKKKTIKKNNKKNVDLFQSKTITLEQEEEPVIVADLLPQGTTEPIETTRTYTYTDVSQSRKQDQTVSDGNVIRYTTAEPSQVQYTTTTVQETEDALPAIHIKMATTGEDREFRTTQIRSTHSQPVHMHTGQVG